MVEDQGRPVTVVGKSLLQICIENEENVYEGDEGWRKRIVNREPKWQLRELMRRLLTDYNCDPNTRDSNYNMTLLSLAAQEYKDESFKMMVMLCKDRLDLNLRNYDGRGIWTICLDGGLFDLLRFLYDEMPNTLDIHNASVEFYGNMITPISKMIQDQQPADMQDLFSRDYWKKLMPESFYIESEIEVDQLLQLMKDEKY